MTSFFPSPNSDSLIFDLADGSGLTRLSDGDGTRSLMQFSKNGATTAASGNVAGTGSYTGADLGQKPFEGFVTFSFTPGDSTSGFGATIISNANGLTEVSDITSPGGLHPTGSLHLVYSYDLALAGYFLGNGTLVTQTVPYLRNCLRDGATKYRAGFQVQPGSINLYLPDGRIVGLSGAEYYNQAGRYCQIESYNNSIAGTNTTFYTATFRAPIITG